MHADIFPKQDFLKETQKYELNCKLLIAKHQNDKMSTFNSVYIEFVTFDLN
jgi:hypothetical protein